MMPEPVQDQVQQTPPQTGQVAAPPETPQVTQTAPEATATAPAASVTPTLLESLRSQGIDIQGSNDQEALSALANRWKEYQQLQQLAPAARSYIQDRDQYTAWKRQQEAEVQKQREQQPKPWYSPWFNPPEYNPAWERQITTDANGNYVAVPGAPPGVVEKFMNYRQHRTELAEKFMSNPYEFIEAPVKHLAQQMAEQAVQKHLQQYQDQNFAKEFVSQQSSWLYERDAQNNVRTQQVMDPNTGRFVNQPVLSQWGGKLRDYVMEESQRQQGRGYSDLAEQQRNALTRVQLEYAISRIGELERGQPAQQPAAPATTPRQDANSQFLRNGNGRPAGPATPPNINPPSQPPKDLVERMRERFKAGGVTDEVLAKDTR